MEFLLICFVASLLIVRLTPASSTMLGERNGCNLSVSFQRGESESKAQKTARHRAIAESVRHDSVHQLANLSFARQHGL
ncbi:MULTISPECIES: hypothetical protein [unclassified Sinorhizobium]|uniref:hypothetical protein n=1 Tax=unclassified Sinorhizobium TaxID=2613772 RepID=UPI003523FDC3